VRSLYRSCRVTRDWLEVWSYRKHGGDKGPLPPLGLRNGVLLKHGEFENPVGLLKEVFLDRWYECGAKPPADATMVDIGANIGAVSLYWAAVSPSLRIHAYALDSVPSRPAPTEPRGERPTKPNGCLPRGGRSRCRGARFMGGYPD
jgi:hypothetical protein